MRWSVIRWCVAVVLMLLSASVVFADSSWVNEQQRSSQMMVLPSGRFLLPIEISVPDLINGVLATFRYFWVRFQWLFGLSDTTIVGAKDPPAHALATASAALKAVPLAPEPVACSPISTVSVEVDDPVRHPYLHKTKVIRRKKRKKRRKKRIEKANTIDWDMVALEAWSLL